MNQENYFKTLHHTTIKQIPHAKAGCLVIINTIKTEDLAGISKRFSLDETILPDILDPYEVPRLENEDDVLYLFARSLAQDIFPYKTVPILLCVTPKSLIVISEQPIPLIQQFLDKQTTTLVTTQKTKLFLQLLLFIIADYQKAFHRIQREVMSLFDDLEEVTNKEIALSAKYESVFSAFLSSLEPLDVMLSHLLTGKYIQLFEEDTELVEDLQQNTKQLIQMTNSAAKNLTTLREAYSTIVSNSLNRTMKFLAAVTLILTIPTMVASFFGMNVRVPFGEEKLGFGLILLVTITLSTGIFIFFKRKDWV